MRSIYMALLTGIVIVVLIVVVQSFSDKNPASSAPSAPKQETVESPAFSGNENDSRKDIELKPRPSNLSAEEVKRLTGTDGDGTKSLPPLPDIQSPPQPSDPNEVLSPPPAINSNSNLPPEMQRQLTAPPPPLPPEMRRQLEEPPPELPPDLRRQLERQQEELPEDIKEALKMKPRVVSEEEVNNPDYVP